MNIIKAKTIPKDVEIVKIPDIITTQFIVDLIKELYPRLEIDKEYIEKIPPSSSLKISENIEIRTIPFGDYDGNMKYIQALYVNGWDLVGGEYLELPNADKKEIKILENLNDFDIQLK